ncbi:MULTISPECIES: aspartate aminotransferase family protein [Gordonia]|uniref:Aminotransferase class III-fold pyridoxal phosphate-dependent enzyme n=1 Tax=Gordonia amicalis TaxID=89053 RepID=A0AAE4U6R5_9ACTN|nr:MULTISPECIES: aminotransferase class III-fold pyridoxal phosphate-dependent enzyme [Gordonia]MCZ4577767.1 aminotransferase class III-fold pyridoxal phosphate-dependent enzyme [Gordonia amicalis]MCZ4651397.1 aminotransferase class III-fold pyridoxal phosphate-dependent enzyme [Gordonia amicalis]MDJ0451238.1 aminotransferase class III-fold pyridoxal phosphate-dependent enzyme [Gordonia amicalis]MDV6310591.1 aminotransferase class III-fold pyridoxal phosphate-dependent enzyme [Gordonia amicalis
MTETVGGVTESGVEMNRVDLDGAGADADRVERWRAEVEAVFESRTATSREAFARAREHIPGGVPGGLGFMSPHPVYFERADGAYAWDADGNKYLDVMSGDWLLPLGHCHPDVLDATITQLRRGTTYCSPHVSLGADLAAELHRRLPSMEQIRFTASGTEATMTALRLARAFTGRPKIAKMRGGYHGTHDLSLVANGRFADPGAIPPGLIPGVEDAVVLLPYNHSDESEQILDRHADEIAAVIVEPILGGTGMIPATPEFLARLREVTRRHGMLLILDEVVSFPMGVHGAQGHFGIEPDLTTLGKAIGGGLPLAAYGGRADIMSLVDPVLDPMTQMRHATTLGGIPATLAAGLAQVRALTPEVHDHLNRLGEQLRQGVRDIGRRRHAPLQVTGFAHVFGIHWTPTPVVDLETALTSDKAVTNLLTTSLYNQGILMFKSALGTVTSPMTDDDVAMFLDALERSVVDSGLVG